MNFPFEYEHKTFRRSKSIKIGVEKSGKVIVTSPKFIPQFVIKQFIKKNESWILKAIEKSKLTQKFESETEIYIFGKKYQKEIIYSDKNKSGIFVIGDKLIFNTLAPKDNLSDSENVSLQKKFKVKTEAFLKNTAGHYIIKRTHEIAKIMKLNFKNITLKKQKTRWGSCSSQKNLNFNWKLGHFEPPIIDYVIIHELSHLVHMDHSKKFWNLVGQYDQSYLNHRGWLKRNGLSLD